MLKTVTITRYGEKEVVYIHIEPYEEDQWYCTVSRIHPSGTRMLGMNYHRNKRSPDDIDKVLHKYVKFLEDYWEVVC